MRLYFFAFVKLTSLFNGSIILVDITRRCFRLDAVVKQKKLNYKWVILAISFLMIFSGLGCFNATKGLFISPVTSALGISRSSYSINDTLCYIAQAITNLFFGTLIYKYGAKRLVALGFVFLILSALSYYFASSAILFYIGGALRGIGFSFASTSMASYIVANWFKKNRGTFTGMVLACNGIGSAISTQVVTPIIYEGTDPFSYRNAYLLITAILVVAGIVIVIFLKDHPDIDDIEADVPSDKKSKKKVQAWNGIEFSEAIKKPYFYIAAVCIFVSGMVLQSIVGVAAAYMTDTGLNASYVATVLSVYSLALTGSKFLAGFLYDKFGLRATSTLCISSAVLSLIALVLVAPTAGGKAFAMAYGIFAAIALPLETVMLPLYAADLFGDKSFNKTMGIFVSVNTAGYAVGTPLINLCYDTFGSYAFAFVVCAVLMLAVVVAIQFCISAAHGLRKQVANEQPADA